ncbi:hypothetical protein [Enterococcus faecalis]|uniref:hypothetical protein n=1 Tax=Enterococcus faecalis TaxID=1351 RepID=UPI0035CAC0BB
MEITKFVNKQVSKTVATVIVLFPGVALGSQVVNAQPLNKEIKYNFAKQSSVENFKEYDMKKNIGDKKTILEATDNSQILKKNLNVINELAKLKDGWDGKGSYAFEERIITSSFELINNLEVQPEIFPTLRQSIQMEYEKGDYYLEFEIFKDRIEYYFDYAGEEEEGFVSKVIDIDFEKINELVNDFVSRTI